MTDEPSLGLDLGPAGPPDGGAYRVLARKYRPQTFDSLIGQEAMVQTLANAFASGRVAHAFMLTGVRGVGKTTTARILARALNCIGEDGARTAPTIQPCGVCANCRAIAESRHVDVFEMDAASRTGVDDVRELIEGVRYLPQTARTKVYIIDEVHMLSKSAFNALLKTLEEPPPHVKFIFATTEIRKVPVTVLSRCQRFDLRRIPAETLIANLGAIAKAEGVAVPEEALALIARAAEGSVRDGQSILDQVIATAGGGQPVTAASVRAMLGLADRTRVLDLFELTMKGDVAAAFDELRGQYNAGADPVAVLQDLLELVHFLTRLKIAPDAAKTAAAPAEETARSVALSASLGMPALTRAWTLLLKGLGETRDAPLPIQAAEMTLARLAYAANLPPLDQLVASIEQDRAASASPGARPAPSPRTPAPAATASAEASPASLAGLEGLQDIIARLARESDFILKERVERHVRLISFSSGHLAFSTPPGAPKDIAPGLADRLRRWTGINWRVEQRDLGGAPSVAEAKAEAKAQLFAEAAEDDVVKAALALFPKARVIDVRPPGVQTSPDDTSGETALDENPPIASEADE